MSWLSDKYHAMIQDYPICELKKHMDEFSICDLKFETEESKYHVQILEKGKFIFSVTPKTQKRKSTKND